MSSPSRDFIGERAKLYKEALKKFPEAREDDIKVMKKYLNPKKGETILEVGAGNGFFSKIISELIGPEGKLIVSDPSMEQLEEINNLNKKNIEVIQAKANEINLEPNSVDAIWSFGAMHHVFEKEESFKNFYKILRKNGRIVIGDVFSNSSLAKHFDERVAKYCVTGHEVAFWSREYAESICYLANLDKPKFYKIDQKWKFRSKKDLGLFLYKIHAMTKTTPEKCLEGAERILGVRKIGNKFELNWPMEIISTKKS